MKDLSIYVIDEIKKYDISSFSMTEMKILIRKITGEWWGKSKDYCVKVKKNFEELTGLNFNSHENSFILNFADHYAEKIFLSTNVTMVKSHIGKIKIDKNIFEEMHYLNKIKNKNTLLLTCHFGGVELIPTTLTLNGMSAAVFVNYKTHAAKNGQISNANDIGLEIFPIGDNLSRKIIYLRKNPRVTMLVCDAFDYWKRENTDKETVVFGRKCRPDQGVDRLAGLMEASVYWGYMKRKNMEEYEFIVKKLHPDDNSYTDAFLKEFEQLINKHPDEYYAWHDMDQLYEIKVMSNV